MKLALVLGKKSGEAIKPRLQNIKDNLDIDVFDNIGEFVYSVSKRNTIYDRVLVLSNLITQTTLKDLHTCWGMYSKETSVIMLSSKGRDEEKAKQFLNVFKTPVACAMLVSSTTVQVIAEAVLRPAAELNSQYGIKDFLSVEVDEDEFTPPPPPPPPEPVKPPVQQQVKPQKGKPEKKKKRGGLLSGIFGSRGDDSDEPQQQSVTEPVTEPPVEQVPEQSFGTQAPSGVVQQQPVAEFSGDDFGDSGFAGDETEPSFSEGIDDFGSSSDFGGGTMPSVSSPKVVDGDDWGAPVVVQPPSQPMQQPDMPAFGQPICGSPQVNPNVVPHDQSSVVDFSFDDTLLVDDPQEDDFAPSGGGATADIDFGSEGTFGSQQPVTPTRKPTGSIEQADENFGDVSLSAAEAQYRAQKEAPKVITRTVREPVLGSGSALKGVYAGRLKKVIIVTGDRGTGITSTAYNIAQTLAKKVDVLYFDCDTDNHGILSYLDYSNFQNYEKMHMEGVKVCRSSQVFDRCVINWDDNFSFLTSDYSVECTDEELQLTAQVVAERSMDYGVVVVDCPVDKLPCISDLILIGQVVICVEASKRGFMNMLCRFEASPLHIRYKRNMISKGSMFVTKCNPKTDMKRLMSYIKAIYQPEDVDWLSIKPIPFNGKLSDSLLNSIMEG